MTGDFDDAEKRALARIALETDVPKLRQTAANARGKSPDVERAAVRRLAEVSPKEAPGTVEHACWTMIYTVEELRRLAGRKVVRMNRMRRKIQDDGEAAALAYCASKRTDGFEEVLAYGAPELTAEAIVLRFPATFDERVRAIARSRLVDAGVNVDENGLIQP
jgi:hypothetical protein